MAARLLLICVACTVGLISGKPIDLNLGLIEEGGAVVGVRAHRLSLRCAPSVPAQVEWTHNNLPIPRGDPRQRRFVAENGSLVITKVLMKAALARTAGNVEENFAFLFPDPPCRITGTGNVTAIKQLTYKPVRRSPTPVVYNKKKGESDAGIYQCKVSNSNGTILSSPTKVAVAAIAHEFSTNPNSTTISEGNLLRLSCYIESTPKATITWFKDGETLHNNKRISTIESELFIANVKFEDAGSYTCNATNALMNKKRTSHAAQVTVEPQTVQNAAFLLPAAHSETKPLTLRNGEKHFLICAASGIPRPNVKWIHSRPDGANSTSQTTHNGLNVFTIEPVANESKGVYTCLASQTINGVSSTISRVVHIEVEVPPVIIEKPKSQVFPAAKTVRIDCEVQGYPTPQVVWYKDGVKLHINGRIKQRVRELVLGAVVTQDTGVYQCFATNSAGIAWAAGRLVVNSSSDQPAAPTDLKCETLSSSRVNLSWNHLAKMDFKAFSVHYFPTDGGDEGNDVTHNDSFVVEKLQPHTNYTFYIRSYSGKSASEQSKRVICRTAEAVPTGAPQVTVTATSSHCVTVQWTPPPLALARGTIVAYEIQWKTVNMASTYFVRVSGGISEHVISGLHGGLEYMVRVIGATSLGWPELNDNQAPWVKVATPQEKSSTLLPPSVQLYSVNSTTLDVVWKYGNDSSIDGFRISYRNSIDIDMKSFSVPANARSFFIPAVEPSKWYEVSVRAYRGSLEGEGCLVRYDSSDLSSSKPALSVPSDLEAYPLSQHSINVSWVFPVPEKTLHSLVFHVHYSLMHPVGEQPPLLTIVTNQTNAVVAGLKPRTSYKIHVQAVGPNDEFGPSSYLIGCKTLPEVVGLVDNIGWKVLSNTSIELTWNPLSFPVTGYTVFYSARLGSDQAEQWQQLSVTQNRTSVKVSDLKSNTEYVVRIRGESAASHGPMSADTFITLPLEGESALNGHTHLSNSVASDQFLGIVVGVSISLCCIALCTGSLLYRKKCAKSQAHPPSTHSENGHCSGQCEHSSLASIEMKDIHPTSPINGMKLPLINGTLPNGNNVEKIVRITDNPQGRRGERSSSHSTDEGDSLLSGPELDEPEETTQITLLVDSSLVVVAPAKETAPDDGFHETHVTAQQW